MLVSIGVCLPLPQFCSLQKSLQRPAAYCSRHLHWSTMILQPESYEDASSVSTSLVEAYLSQGSEYIAAAPWGQHRAGFPQRLQVLGLAPIGAAPGGTAAMLEAVKQVLTCLRKSGSLLLEVLVIHSALELKCPCLPCAAIALMIFKLFIHIQSSWPYFSVTCQHSQRVGIQIWGWTHKHSLRAAQCALPGPFSLTFCAQEMCYSQLVCEGSISFAIEPCMGSNMSGFVGACVYLWIWASRGANLSILHKDNSV